jgi:hypothetical protein
MLFPVMIVCIGYGIYGTIDYSPKRYRYLVMWGVALLYFGSVINFGYIYFLKYPLQEYGDVHMRILSQYLLLNQKRNIPVSVYSDSNIDFLNKYLFYTNSLNGRTIAILQKTNFSNGFRLNGINFYSCKKSPDTYTASGVVIIDALCTTQTISQHVSISRLIDGGEVYKIYHDSVCNTYNLQPYPNHITIAQLAVDSLREKQFCETYINRR